MKTDRPRPGHDATRPWPVAAGRRAGDDGPRPLNESQPAAEWEIRVRWSWLHLESVDLKLERYGLGLRLRHADFKKVLAHAT